MAGSAIISSSTTNDAIASCKGEIMGFTNAGLLNGGGTAHYQISYDDTLSAANGVTLAAQVMAACEQDFTLMQGWFSGVEFRFSFPIAVQIANASGGATWSDPSNLGSVFGYNPTVSINPGPASTSDLIRYLLVSEVAEMFMASQEGGWYEEPSLTSGADEGSKGEGLSRFLGGQFKVANGLRNVRYPDFEVVALWLNSPGRPNYVDNNPDDHQTDAVVGCTTCFLYYLHDQLGYDVNVIISNGSSTLGSVYSKLTGRSDGWASFINLVNTYYPQGNTYYSAGDDIFPVANLDNLSDAQIPAGASYNLMLLSLDNHAPANVIVGLTSDNPAILKVLPQVTIPVGAWAAAVDLTAAPITGPMQAVNIHATYAGKTLTSNVQILPRASILQGLVTDVASKPLLDVTVMLESDVVILPGSGSTLQMSTDVTGLYQTPIIPPNVYKINASQDGFLVSETSVTVSEGVPVTTQNFVLVATKPFTINGTVNAEDGSTIAGATVNQVLTDASGHYTFSDYPAEPFDGKIVVGAAMTGFVSSGVTITIPNGATITQNFVLIPLGSLLGTIRDTSGNPIADAAVAAGPISGYSDASGHYNLTALVPGPTVVTASAPGFNQTSLTLMVNAGVVTAQDLALTPASAVLSGRVTGTDNGLTISGASVRAGASVVKTDGTGTYTIPGLAAGQYTVTASAFRYQPEQASVALIDHESTSQDFQLDPVHQPPF
jgi:hypothetical protein